MSAIGIEVLRVSSLGKKLFSIWQKWISLWISLMLYEKSIGWFCYSLFSKVSTQVIDYHEQDDMVFVPESISNLNKYLVNIKVNGRDGRKPLQNGCLNLKVVYNRAWVNSAGRGSLSIAMQRLSQVLSEAENIYNNKFLHSNQLGFNLDLILLKGNISRDYLNDIL